MSVSAFPYGIIAASAASASVYTENVSQSHNASGFNNSVASVRVGADGFVKTAGQTDTFPTDGEYFNDFEWLLSGSASDYDVRATILSGPTEEGFAYAGNAESFDTWMQMLDDRDWHLKDDANFSFGVQTDMTVLIEFSLTGNATAIASFEAALDAQCFT